MPALCPRHPKKDIADGMMVCEHCRQQLGKDLDYIASNWYHLTELHTATRGGSGRTVHADPPVPIRCDVVDSMNPNAKADVPMAVVVQSWARLVAEDRELAQRDHHIARVALWCSRLGIRYVPAWTMPPLTAGRQARWLIKHTRWLCGSPFAEEAIDELAGVRWSLASTIGDSAQGRTLQCPCGAPVRVQSWVPLDGKANAPTVRCHGCGTRWDVRTLLDYGTCQCEVPWAPCEPPQTWCDAEAITVMMGVSRATLDRWAKHGKIQRSHGRFLLGEVRETAQRYGVSGA